ESMWVSATKAALRTPQSVPSRRASDLQTGGHLGVRADVGGHGGGHPAGGDGVHPDPRLGVAHRHGPGERDDAALAGGIGVGVVGDLKSTRLNSSHVKHSYAVFCM